MVSKNQIKLVKSLQQKKYRNQYGLFVVEGVKAVRELLDSEFTVYRIFASDVSVFDGHDAAVEFVTEAELRQMSGFTTPNTVIGVFEMAKVGNIDFSDWILAVDDVRDPGNLGTIIRLCDWFGIQHLVCSATTVDCYNPKTLQATMGSIARVQVGYTDLEDFLRKTDLPIFGAFMEGQPVYTTKIPEKGILVMGNEAKGISSEVQALVSEKISIPQFGKNSAESLNVATATAILLNEIRRR
ncbi:RNA methyltransferase, TrmH family [Pricia antarctica]|uniref:RNA methyltransferase, TrmH family n=1 Tax=Pricia antarctica TaxID=641691 RepID=A0A1G7GJJ3_9FLAO|nr:RNA methyltransferase [Pricia antarctica]SDE88274.1 RNA methyltransferase, TrmH family [Pricia antarctica]